MLKRLLAILTLAGLLASLAHPVGLITASGGRTSGSSSSSSSSSGGAADGASYPFTSPVSVSAPPSKEFLGGSGGVIVSGTTNTAFSRSGWTKLSGSTVADWYFSTSQTLNRSKSLLYDGAARGEADAGPGDTSGNARGTQQYDTGAAGFKKMHRSTWYYWNWPHLDATQTQWKIQRWQSETDGGNPQVVDCVVPSAYFTSHQNYDTSVLINHFTNGGGCNNDGTAVFTSASEIVPRNVWFRLDTYVQENTPAGTANGVFRVKVTQYSNPSLTWTENSTNRTFRGSADNANVLRYPIYQNYLGNAAGIYGAWENSTIFMDDLYIGWVTSLSDTLYRVEMIDTNSLATATHPGVIQDITAASGTAWTVTLNAGYWSTVTGRYLVVIRCDDETVMGYVGPIASLQPANDDIFERLDLARAA